MSKLQTDSKRYKNYENEEKKRTGNISFKNEMKALFINTLSKKEFTSQKLEEMKAKRSYNFGIVKTYKNIGERFDNYKSYFNMKLNEFENAFENKLLNRNTFSQKKKNSTNNKSYKTTKNKNSFISKKINDSYKNSNLYYLF